MFDSVTVIALNMRMFDSVYCTDNENDFLTVFIALIMTMFDSVY